MIPLISGIQFLKGYKGTYLQNRKDLLKTNLWLSKDKCRGGGINQELQFNRDTLLNIRQKVNKDLLYSTGNTTQYFVITCMRKESAKRMNICTT